VVAAADGQTFNSGGAVLIMFWFKMPGDLSKRAGDSRKSSWPCAHLHFDESSICLQLPISKYEHGFVLNNPFS
jgi:hypothetical protein